eukprot:GEMP01010009.1.p1 GENE.GEMP01010009.1~~GEMP01010009.1.p1  ORF type:complete len:700 (+),score=137.52 GEMP01010009.1:367-2466(+)
MTLKVLVGCLCVMISLYAIKLWSTYMTPIAEIFLEEEYDDDYPSTDQPTTKRKQETIKRAADTPYDKAYAFFSTGDVDQAMEIALACAQEDSRCKEFLAELYFIVADKRNATKAFELLHEVAADDGNAEAQYALGILYGNMFKNISDYQSSEAMAVTYLYAASTAGHDGALMAMGYRHLHGLGVPKTCTTAALNYLEVAKRVTGIYSSGMPQAVELIRLNLEKDRKVISSSEINLFMQIASAGDTHVAAAIGKRYLLGLEGFQQDYKLALQYLRIAASKSHPGALGLLGYMYALALGVDENLQVAHSYFTSAAQFDDALGYNGLGYIHYTGTQSIQRDLRLAFENFNASAFTGSADGMFNLASVYLTGSGVEQSFRKATLWYTHALDRGHTPAAYSLALMHLNGVGTVRDCKIAVELLKKVTERGPWISDRLHLSYDLQERNPDAAAFVMLKLAETGHEVSQMNLAHLLDTQATHIFRNVNPNINEEDASDTDKRNNKIYAQRFYEMSADLGSASSELRLGDYAYYGWGIEVATDDVVAETPATKVEGGVDPDWTHTYLMEEERQLQRKSQYREQQVSFTNALAHYRKTADMKITGEWMQTFVSRASFNLGYMHQFGVGIPQDLNTAKRHYQKCLEIDPTMDAMPISIMVQILQWQKELITLPPWEDIQHRIVEDLRFHALVLLSILLVSLLHLRRRLV